MHTAGTDPAYIPGLTPKPPAEAADVAPDDAAEQAAEHSAEDSAAEDAATDEEAASGQETDAAEGTDAEGEAAPEEGADPEVDAEEGADEKAAGPAFAVSDRRSSITADRTGVTLKLDAEQAEFRWDEIGAVEIDTPRFGRRFAITVYTTGRRWYEADVEASSRRALKNWTAELDAVLDAYFEESAP